MPPYGAPGSLHRALSQKGEAFIGSSASYFTKPCRRGRRSTVSNRRHEQEDGDDGHTEDEAEPDGWGRKLPR
jgi:hypothetical protein